VSQWGVWWVPLARLIISIFWLRAHCCLPTLVEVSSFSCRFDETWRWPEEDDLPNSHHEDIFSTAICFFLFFFRGGLEAQELKELHHHPT
jgi:hypothetical protein